ncbi:hypothetical protein NYR55_09320 [Sphingomonas sp. BGYR3]|uniref:hypothetical protein n=1 Tax=Sphingomonas sp. BGYR3 TaxID=2975483 RepID=UPI0021A2ACC8|nr:hypothetical protein [Sphingomonas sp. BGYR3]MDG5488816.1 hypothetical protein [Sphingomonas sp. BGYR3]
MRVSIIIKASVAAAGFVVAMPAFAQTTGGQTNTTIDDNSDDNVVINDLLDVFSVDNAADSYSESYTKTYASADQDNDGNNSHNGNTMIVASQSLKAMNINRELDEVVDLDGEDGSDTAVGYNSGSNSVNDNAFAAFAGINNAAWNTGINANTQAATNIAAQGTVNFGVSGSAGSGGGDAD